MVDQNFGGLMAFEPHCLLLGLWHWHAVCRQVVIVFVADFVQPLFLSIYLYQTLIKQFGNETTLFKANNLFAVVPTMTGLTASIVQIYFAWRIRILTNNWYYFFFIIAAAVSGAASSTVVAYLGSFNSEFVEFRAFKVVAIVTFVSEMLGDIMITSILVWFLQTRKSGFGRSNKMVDRIIRFTVQTGLLTLIFACLDMVFYLTRPDGTHLVFNFILSKLYTSSFLSSLNSRQGHGYDTSDNNDVDLGTDLNFFNNAQLTVDQTSVVITTPPESLQNWHELEVKGNSSTDLEASVWVRNAWLAERAICKK